MENMAGFLLVADLAPVNILTFLLTLLYSFRLTLVPLHKLTFLLGLSVANLPWNGSARLFCNLFWDCLALLAGHVSAHLLWHLLAPLGLNLGANLFGDLLDQVLANLVRNVLALSPG